MLATIGKVQEDDPMGVEGIADEAWAMVGATHESVLTTLRKDGRPVSLPVWHVVLDNRIYVRTPRVSNKVTRILNDPRGSFVVSSGHTFPELAGVIAEVDVSVVGDDELAARAISALDAKHPDFGPAIGKLPSEMQEVFANACILQLDVIGSFTTWNNAGLFDG